jgi:hypothetical protein
MAKEGEEFFVDDGFINKYIREDNNDVETSLFKKRFVGGTNHSGAVEVFGSVGEGESFLEGSNFNRRWGNKGGFSSNDSDEGDEKKTKFNSNTASKARQEFLKELDDDSLTVDTCSKVAHDWKK